MSDLSFEKENTMEKEEEDQIAEVGNRVDAIAINNRRRQESTNIPLDVNQNDQNAFSTKEAGEIGRKHTNSSQGNENTGYQPEKGEEITENNSIPFFLKFSGMNFTVNDEDILKESQLAFNGDIEDVVKSSQLHIPQENLDEVLLQSQLNFTKENIEDDLQVNQTHFSSENVNDILKEGEKGFIHGDGQVQRGGDPFQEVVAFSESFREEPDQEEEYVEISKGLEAKDILVEHGMPDQEELVVQENQQEQLGKEVRRDKEFNNNKHNNLAILQLSNEEMSVSEKNEIIFIRGASEPEQKENYTSTMNDPAKNNLSNLSRTSQKTPKKPKKELQKPSEKREKKIFRLKIKKKKKFNQYLTNVLYQMNQKFIQKQIQ